MAKLIDEVYLLHETNLLRLEKVAVLSNTQKLTQRVKENEEMRNMFQTKWRLSDLSNSFKREFTKMLTKVRRAMNEESENFKKRKHFFKVPN